MPKTAILFGFLLASLSLTAVLLTGELNHPTQFIPAIFGGILVVCGVIGLKGGNARKHSMHVAAMIALLAALAGLGRGIPQLIKLVKGEEVKPIALSMIIAMAVLSIIFLVLCIQSFRAARIARQNAEPS